MLQPARRIQSHRRRWVYAANDVCYACKMVPQIPDTSRLGSVSSSSGGAHANDRADAITSRENKWLKIFRSALRGTGPSKADPIAVEGPKLVENALRSGLEAEALLVSKTGESELERILSAASESEAVIPRSRILRTTDKLFESVAGTDAPQGVAALFRQRNWGFDDVLRGTSKMLEGFPLILVLAAIQDPGNVGTILRSAEAFGATGVIAARGTADPWSPKALRASAGSALRVPLLRGIAVPVLLAQLRLADVKLYVASSVPQGDRKAAAHSAGGVDLRGSAAIFIGNEGSGVPSEIAHVADAMISIATSDAVESLNAGVAASIVLYEAARQRKAQR